jgi:hypothetical protein
MNQAILNELKESSRIKLNNLNVVLSSTIQGYFDTVLTDSVNRMERENRISITDINLAKQNINVLIDSLAIYREKQFGEKDIIRYQALNESRKGLCPLWPIC